MQMALCPEPLALFGAKISFISSLYTLQSIIGYGHVVSNCVLTVVGMKDTGVLAKVLNRQTRTADKECYSSLESGRR